MSLLERISIDSAVRFGKPCVRGTRITVGDVLEYLTAGETEAQLLKESPAEVADLLRRHVADIQQSVEEAEVTFLEPG